MNTSTALRPLTLSAALLAALTFAGAATAQEPTVPAVSERAMLRGAQGEYLLEDGRTLKVQVGLRRLVVSLDQSPLETWQAANTELLISPDGLRRLRLYRSEDGSVDRVALETDRVR